MTNELQRGDTIRCHDRDEMLEVITQLTADGFEVRVVARWTVKVEGVKDEEKP